MRQRRSRRSNRHRCRHNGHLVLWSCSPHCRWDLMGHPGRPEHVQKQRRRRPVCLRAAGTRTVRISYRAALPFVRPAGSSCLLASSLPPRRAATQCHNSAFRARSLLMWRNRNHAVGLAIRSPLEPNSNACASLLNCGASLKVFLLISPIQVNFVHLHFKINMSTPIFKVISLTSANDWKTRRNFDIC